MIASLKGHVDVVRVLIEAHAHVNQNAKVSTCRSSSACLYCYAMYIYMCVGLYPLSTCSHSLLLIPYYRMVEELLTEPGTMATWRWCSYCYSLEHRYVPSNRAIHDSNVTVLQICHITPISVTFLYRFEGHMDTISQLNYVSTIYMQYICTCDNIYSVVYMHMCIVIHH